jgi:hypothetical protein
MKDFKVIFDAQEREKILEDFNQISFHISEIIYDFSISEYENYNIIKLKEHIENIKNEFK